MINKARKGQRKELLARKQLEEEGCRVLFKSQRTRFGPIDFAHLFDIVAVGFSTWRFVSCKHYGKSGKYAQHQRDILHFAEEYFLEKMIAELWIWHRPAWVGRGKNKKWVRGYFEKIVIWNRDMNKLC